MAQTDSSGSSMNMGLILGIILAILVVGGLWFMFSGRSAPMMSTQPGQSTQQPQSTQQAQATQKPQATQQAQATPRP
ncbi:MAG: hypothetical protein Q7O66_22505 [Dehalococcoidia bacterium]|nr:hypothetical protein [Dehalococcoidia bacterium]